MGLKALLITLTVFHFISWIFVIVATAVTDWSKSDIREYGIWRICQPPNQSSQCFNWVLTGSTVNDSIKDCEGAVTATRAFSVMSIIFIGFCLFISIALIVKTTLIKKTTVLVNLCMVLVTNLWVFLGWVMYLGVQARGQCAWNDYTTWFGSSWFLQLFAWIIEFLICIPIAVVIFLKWKKIPRYVGQPPFVPGPVPYAPTGAYPQYKSPYPSGPVPYAAPKAPYYPYGPPAAPAYSGVYGPTPNTSPYMPTPYW